MQHVYKVIIFLANQFVDRLVAHAAAASKNAYLP